MKALESGYVRVLGHEVDHNRSSKVGHLIGFMPQNTALIPELTIRETLIYFGNIFLMKKQHLEERSKMIKELLELPPEDRQIQHLSGGQRRRVSLAAAIIHNPLILILDEPTVGLDSILREKIWKFLIKLTRDSNFSIIITTHYISEAQQSDRCGMMRDGILLVENSPTKILSKYGAQNLDEAFLNLCLFKKNKVSYEPKSISNSTDGVGEKFCGIQSTNSFKHRKKINLQTVSALSKKEYIRLKRQIA
jgi:ABC-type multidrug transport system ATPase subunit